MYQYKQIKTIHLEITSKCNARCPMCARTVCGGKNNPFLPLEELSLKDIQKIFSRDFLLQLKRIYLCGNYGDPIVASDTLASLRYFREINPKLRLDLFTNGSARKEDWWKELAGTVNLVHFSVDGLEDTNHLYRKGTHFPTILKNMKIYLRAGGTAVWDFIVFRHNEHQVETARSMAKKLGFKSFNVKKTGRFFNVTQARGKDRQAVLNRRGEVDYFIEKPLNEKYLNKALLKEDHLVKKYGSLSTYLDQTHIKCKVLREKSLYVSAEAYVFPCCWTAGQLYPWFIEEKSSPLWKMIDELEGGIKSLSAREKTIESIVNGPFFQKTLIDSWNKPSIKEGKLKCCAKTCGTEFDPFKEQFKTH